LSIPVSLQFQERWAWNGIVKNKLQEILQRMTQGYSFVEALESTLPLPSLCVHLLKQGEETGTLSQAVEDVSLILHESLQHHFQKMITWIQPFLLILIGVCLMGGVLTILGPLYEINGMAHE
jgi:type II secretory pathway component PulF